MNRNFFFILSLSTLFLPHLVSTPPTLTLPEAIQKGLQKRSILKAITQEEHALDQRSKAAMSNWLPRFSISTGIDNASGNGIGTTPSFFQFSGEQLLFDGATPYDRSAILQEQKKSIEAKYRLTEDNIRFEIETSFLRAWLTKEQQKIIAALITSTKTSFDQKKTEYAEKMLDQTAWYQAQSQFAQQTTSVDNYTKEYQKRLTELCFALGEMNPTNYQLIFKPAPQLTLKSIDEYRQLAFAHRKEIKIIEKQIKALKKEATLQLKKYLPTISVFGKVNLQEGHPNTPTSSKNGGLQLSWNFFDGMYNHFQAQALQHEILQKELTISGLKKQISKEIHLAYNDLLIKQNALKAEQFKLRAAKSDLDKKTEELKVGSATQADFDIRKLTFEEARFNWISTRIELALAEQQLHFSAGYPTL